MSALPPGRDAEPCPNCGHCVQGKYCSECGQKHGGVRVTLGSIVHELLDEFFHFDAKLVQTLRPLFFQPGRLSLDYWAGKRARFMRPLQLYLAAAFLFFFAAQFVQAQVLMVKVDAKTEVSALKEDDPQGSLLEKKLDAYIRSHDAAQISKDVVTSVSEQFPKVMFGAIPLFALLCMGLFRRSHRFYAEHFIFALHFHAFVFLSGLIRLPLPKWLSQALLLVYPVYLGLALHRAYGESIPRTVLKLVALTAIYLTVLGSAVAAIAISHMLGVF